MGCESCGQPEDLNPEGAFYQKNKFNKTGIKRNPSLSTNNSEDESYLNNKIENHRNLVDDTEEEDDDYNIDEQIARNLVASLLENDFFFKDLIPTINSLSSKDFKKLFHGDCDYNYKSKNKAQIRRLAHKFDNFNYILKFIYKESKYEEYFKELWEKYPYIEDLKHLEEDKISSKLNSTLPNFKYWPENIKKDLIILIKSTELSSSKEYIRIIKDEYVEVDKTLKKLINIKNTFKKDDDDEYYKKNDNVFGKDIDKIFEYFNQNSKDKNKQLTEKDKQKIQKEINQQKNDYVDISPYLQENFDAIIDGVIFSVMKKLGVKSPKKEALGVSKSYENEHFDDDSLDDCVYEDSDDDDDDYNGEGKDNDEEKEMKEWLSVAKNFALLVYRGYQTYQTIQLSKKLIGEFKAELESISKDFEEYQNSKRFCKNNPSENLKIINESIEKNEKIRNRLLDFIKKLKKEIDSNIKRKKDLLVIYFIKYLKLVQIFLTYKNPSHIINILNIGIEAANIVFSGIEISYTNDIIDGLIEILKDANKKRKEVENEINSLHDQTSNIKKGYPNYYI